MLRMVDRAREDLELVALSPPVLTFPVAFVDKMCAGTKVQRENTVEPSDVSLED